jgi:hypothetical protein
MLLKNLKLVRDTLHFSQFCQQLIISKNVRSKEKRDVVNLEQVDPVQELLEESPPNEAYLSLFDEINRSQTQMLMGL